jgi:hypothetical protein
MMMPERNQKYSYYINMGKNALKKKKNLIEGNIKKVNLGSSWPCF